MIHEKSIKRISKDMVKTQYVKVINFKKIHLD
jgi:hypothetical protein